ncbi:MAG: glycogen synthase [Chloroflexi bacterium]|nr:glycogen synthase [Chloroflexota bacterium]
MRIAMVASECEPFAKTGGLADVVDALSRSLGRRGHEVDVFLPRYRAIDPPGGGAAERLDVPVATAPPVAGARPVAGRPPTTEVIVWTIEEADRRVRLVDHPASFDRPGHYGEGSDYEDNGARFSLFGRAVLAALDLDHQRPDVLHGHDWQSGPALMWAAAQDDAAGRTAQSPSRVLTCHNLAYHGWLPADRAWQVGLPAPAGGREGIDLLGEAIATAGLVNTVSPTFARESLTRQYGGGLHEALRALGDRYVGILNGIDTVLWDPATDPALAANYGRGDRDGKENCRADLCARHGLDPSGPIFGMVGRLDPQKGFDLVAAAAHQLIAMGGRLIVLGTGDASLLADLRATGQAAPDRVAVIDRFDRDEARRIYAGADIFLMPSRFEPSGQGQLIALRYGTAPLVRRTGGLADTVRDVDEQPATGNGFCFDAAEPTELVAAARRAVAALASAPRWAALVERGMAEDHSWDAPAAEYEAAYERALALP